MRTGKRAGDKTYWPGAGPAAEAGCRASLGRPRGADGQREEGGGTRKQRSILSELGSYPRGHRTGLAQGESQRRRELGEVQLCYFYHFSLNLNVSEKRKETHSMRAKDVCAHG